MAGSQGCLDRTVTWDMSLSKALNEFVLDFQYVAPDPFKGQISYFCLSSPVKNKEGIGTISKSIFRRIIYAPNTSFSLLRFLTCSSVLKPERFRGDLCRKARPHLILFDPLRISRAVVRCLSGFYQQRVRSSTRRTFVSRVARVDILCVGVNGNLLAMSIRSQSAMSISVT